MSVFPDIPSAYASENWGFARTSSKDSHAVLHIVTADRSRFSGNGVNLNVKSLCLPRAGLAGWFCAGLGAFGCCVSGRSSLSVEGVCITRTNNVRRLYKYRDIDWPSAHCSILSASTGGATGVVVWMTLL